MELSFFLHIDTPLLKIFLFTFLLSFSSLTAFGQLGLLEDAAVAIAESGSIIFSNDYHTFKKKKEVQKKITFNANETIHGTLYMKQKVERLYGREIDGQWTISVTFALYNNREKGFLLNIPVQKSEYENRFLCFEIVPEQLDIQNPNHFSFLSFIQDLDDKAHSFNVYLTKRSGVKGKMTLDLSKGKGKYQAVFDELEKEKARIAAEKEAARIAAAEEAAHRAAVRKKIIATYESSTDFVGVSLQNKGYTGVSGRLKTQNSVTDKSFSVASKNTYLLRCRPGEKIYINDELVFEVLSNSNGKSIYISPTPIVINKISTQWNNDDAWKSWNIETSDRSKWTMSTQWNNDDAWKSWNIKAGHQQWSVNTQWNNDDAWKSWVFKTKEENISISTVWNNDDAWKQWSVNSPKYGKMTVQTTWNNDDAWKQWTITSDFGKMTVQTTWNNDDAWKQWTITDNMKDAPPQLKTAAIFCCLLSGILPQTASNAAGANFCSHNGIELFGKIKFVDYGEDIKIKYVDYGEDIKVKFVDYGADECGEWQEVEYSENIKIKVVDYGEDLKVKKVDYGHGMK